MRNSLWIILAVVAGSGLFLAAFAAIFNGLSGALGVAVAGYLVVAALLGRYSPIGPWALALALVAPALPFALNFFVALIGEAGLARALLWPAGIALCFALSMAGAFLGARGRAARPTR